MELYLSRVVTDSGGPEQWIRLPKSESDELHLGRASDTSVRLLSPHVSRSHAIIAHRENGSFAIKDTKSLNGIHINGEKASSETWVKLNDGDTVEIGRPEQNDILSSMSSSDRFIYMVKCSTTSELDKKVSGPRNHVSSLVEKMKPQKRAVKSTDDVAPVKMAVKRRPATCNHTNHEPGDGDHIEAPGAKPETTSGVKVVSSVSTKIFLPKTSKKSEEMVQENKRLKLELDEKLQELHREIEMRDKKLQEQQAKLVEEYERDYRNRLEQKEEELEMRLQLEKDLAIEQSTTSSAKDEKPSETVKSMVDTMESELQCSICSELFILATTLNCAHTFCQFCISEWQKVKRICPVCRSPIMTVTQSLVLDNYIDKALESLSNELRENRSKLIEERKKAAEVQKCAKVRTTRGGRRGRGSERARRGFTPRGRGRYGASAPGIRTRSTVIVISDPESSDTTTTSDDSSSTEDDTSDSSD